MKKDKLEELHIILKNPDFLDLDPQKAIQIAERFSKNKSKIEKVSKSIKLAILSNFNMDFLTKPLQFCLYQRGIDAQIHVSNYGTMITELLNPNSESFKFKPDYILIWPTYRDLQKYKSSLKDEIDFWKKLWDISLSKEINIIQILFDTPQYYFSKMTFYLKKPSIVNHIKNTNKKLEESNKDIKFISLDNLIFNLGSKKWQDNRMYHLCKQPFALEAIPEISQFFSAEISGILGFSKKVLIFDLDNTIWGGEIGDVGLEGIILGKETAEGEAYVDFQNYIKTLNKLGIILAVCSKNYEENATEPFSKHPDMIIKREDISFFSANFNDKAENITQIKEFLNIGYDSIVFVDDSAVECQWVKNKLPDVTTINLKGNPSTFVTQIDRLGLFTKDNITTEDSNRINTYQTNKKIEQVKINEGDLQKFLKSLSPLLTVEKIDLYSLDRVEQLILKTNQFKLNSDTFNKSYIKKNKKNFLTFRFKDNLTDYGIVVIVVYFINEKTLNIHNWVMSCRVFDRNIEFTIVSILQKLAKRNSCLKISLKFEKLLKNLPAKLAIEKIGFKKKSLSFYEIDVSKVLKNDFIKVKNLERILIDG